ncbi:hypothetical protein N7456_006538 [Penicillium angulare]|uniref:Uncharacterized protein n=1 Tax=Penicillium angulare TaxID=116970 RepID=A0A9W9KCA3_9EURO|nr:hypothetical protein N7456_006538 [Penicillium angulare]
MRHILFDTPVLDLIILHIELSHFLSNDDPHISPITWALWPYLCVRSSTGNFLSSPIPRLKTDLNTIATDGRWFDTYTPFNSFIWWKRILSEPPVKLPVLGFGNISLRLNPIVPIDGLVPGLVDEAKEHEIILNKALYCPQALCDVLIRKSSSGKATVPRSVRRLQFG